MMKHEIEIEGLPEGWKAIAYRVPSKDEYTLSDDGDIVPAKGIKFPVLIVEKIQPRRIVLEEISREEYYRLFHDEQCTEIYNLQGSHWKQVKEGEE